MTSSCELIPFARHNNDEQEAREVSFGCRLSVVGYRLSVTGCRLPVAGASFEFRFSTFDLRPLTFDSQLSTLDFCPSPLTTRHSPLCLLPSEPETILSHTESRGYDTICDSGNCRSDRNRRMSGKRTSGCGSCEFDGFRGVERAGGSRIPRRPPQLVDDVAYRGARSRHVLRFVSHHHALWPRAAGAARRDGRADALIDRAEIPRECA